jgi:hypothetical protein
MRREDVVGLRYITRVANVRSIETRGILCHQAASRLDHVTIAAAEIQERRRRKTVPQGMPLHRYANLYLNARNKMMYRVVSEQNVRNVCVVDVAPDVMDLEGAVVSDQNAASGYARFAPLPAGLALIDAAQVFAESWHDPDDQVAEWRLGSVMCAEVLIPEIVEPRYLRGVFVADEPTRARVVGEGVGLPVQVDPRMFFR